MATVFGDGKLTFFVHFWWCDFRESVFTSIFPAYTCKE